MHLNVLAVGFMVQTKLCNFRSVCTKMVKNVLFTICDPLSTQCSMLSTVIVKLSASPCLTWFGHKPDLFCAWGASNILKQHQVAFESLHNSPVHSMYHYIIMRFVTEKLNKPGQSGFDIFVSFSTFSQYFFHMGNAHVMHSTLLLATVPFLLLPLRGAEGRKVHFKHSGFNSTD